MKQVTYTSKDGTKVPMFVLSKKGLEPRGNAPTLLYGYGGFDISLSPAYDADLRIWLDKGGVYAIANLREAENSAVSGTPPAGLASKTSLTTSSRPGNT